jgi:hypothetical protein
MSRLGVNHNLISWLRALKPKSENHSCAIRLANKKFVVDMNLTYRLDAETIASPITRYFNLMGVRPHGVTIVFDYDIDDYEEKNIWTYLVKYLIFNKGNRWYSYNKDDNEFGIELKIHIKGELIEVLTPKPIRIYEYTYSDYKNLTEICMTEDLITYKSVRYYDRQPNVYFGKTVYTKTYSRNFLAGGSTHGDLIKILVDN